MTEKPESELPESLRDPIEVMERIREMSAHRLASPFRGPPKEQNVVDLGTRSPTVKRSSELTVRQLEAGKKALFRVCEDPTFDDVRAVIDAVLQAAPDEPEAIPDQP